MRREWSNQASILIRTAGRSWEKDGEQHKQRDLALVLGFEQ